MVYLKKTKLGKGAYGEVWLGLNTKTREKIAIKTIFKPDRKSYSFDRMIIRERIVPIVIQKGVCHSNIACLLDFVETPDEYQFIYQYIPGIDMFKWSIPPNIYILLNVAYILSDAFNFMHQRGVAHRDIKPQNIIMKSEIPFIIDFGLSCILESKTLTIPNSKQASCSLLSNITGTPNYMAPENLTSAKLDYFKTDVYSLGVLFFYLFNDKQLPIRTTTKDPKILYQEKSVPPKKSRSGNPIDGLIDQMIKFNPKDRPTMSEVKDQITEIISSMSASRALNWEETDTIFQPESRFRIINNIRLIPTKKPFPTKIFTELKKFKGESEKTEYQFENIRVHNDVKPGMVRKWLGKDFRCEFWLFNEGYAFIFSLTNNYLIIAVQDNRLYIINPAFKYEYSYEKENYDFPMFNLEQLIYYINITIERILKY